MAVVTKYGQGYRDPASLADVLAVHAEGRIRGIIGNVAVANGDSINSKHYFGKIPSHAIILPSSVIYHGSITSLNDYDIGLEDNGTVVDADILADGLDLTSAGSKSVVAAVAAANYHKRVWEILGLTRDPGKVYDVVGLLKAASGAASFVSMFLYYSKN